jgi:predicted nucleic-acid-binding Zn-ribbon protein
MKRTNKCPKCGSSDVITNAKAIDRADNGALSVSTFRKPDALLLKGQLTTTLSAWVCADCGYLELYADDPKRIKVATA